MVLSYYILLIIIALTPFFIILILLLFLVIITLKCSEELDKALEILNSRPLLGCPVYVSELTTSSISYFVGLILLSVLTNISKHNACRVTQDYIEL